MIDHLLLKVHDINESKVFYEKLLATLNMEIKLDFDTSVSFGDKGITKGDPAGDFMITEGKTADVHVAFSATSTEEVDSFYKTALKLGAKDNGKPALRPYADYYYAAYVFDINGYNIEAVFHGDSSN